MSLHVWWLYVTAVFLISATPGPNMLHVMTQSIHHGPRRSIATMAGLMSAILLCLIASALGLGALLKTSPRLFDGLRYAGVAYLLWLGIKAWRAPIGEADEVGATRARSLRALYGTGLLTGLSNPKLIIFAAALFPQFIDHHAGGFERGVLLVTGYAALVVIIHSLYALLALKARTWLVSRRGGRVLNRLSGAAFVIFGVALATSSPRLPR